MNFPVLSVITFTPLVAALLILLLPAERKNEARAVALAAAIFALILSIWVYFSYDQSAAGYQFIEKYNWLPMLGISLYFGVDGMSTPLVLLTGVVILTGLLISWGDDDKHVMAGGKLAEVAGEFVSGENVHQAIGTGLDRIPRLLF